MENRITIGCESKIAPKKHYFKKSLSLLLSLMMFFSITAGIETSASAATITSNAVVSYARKYIGCPYVYGSTGPKSFDCSGLVHYVYKHFGINIPASSRTIYNSPKSYGKLISTGSISKAIPGDIICWNGHVALYAGNGLTVEAITPNGVIEGYSYDGGDYKVIRPKGLTKSSLLSTPKLNVKVNSNGSFSLSWNKIKNADKYELYIIDNSDGRYKLLKRTTKTSYKTSVAAYGQGYCYSVRAVNSKNGSISAFGEVWACNDKKLQKPKLKIAVNSNGKFKLSWNKVTGATSYKIYQKQSDGSYKLVKTTSKTSYTTGTAAYGKQYTYKMRALTSQNSSAISSYSAEVKAKNTKKLQTPKLKVNVNSNGSFTLSWNKISGATSYQLYVKQSNGKFKLLKKTSKTSYTTGVMASGKKCTYKMMAVTSKNKSASSAYSTTVTATNKKLSTPKMKATVNKDGSFTLSWNKVTNAVSYEIYQKQSDGSYKLVKTTSETSYTTGTAVLDKKYTYKMRAVTGKSAAAFAPSNYSSVVEVTYHIHNWVSKFRQILVKEAWDETVYETVTQSEQHYFCKTCGIDETEAFRKDPQGCSSTMMWHMKHVNETDCSGGSRSQLVTITEQVMKTIHHDAQYETETWYECSCGAKK